MAKAKKEQVPTTEEQKVTEPNAVNGTEFLDSMAGTGYEGMSASDFQIPFLRVLQPLSPQVQVGGDEYVEGARPGEFYNTLTGTLYGPRIQLIPIKPVTEILEWTLGARGKLVARHAPGTVEQVPGESFGKMYSAAGNELVETMLIYCLVANAIEEGPVIFPLAKTAIKHGRKWNSLIHRQQLPSGLPAPYFGGVWELFSTLQKNDKGSWYAIGGGNKSNIRFVRFITREEYLGGVKSAHELVSDLSKSKAMLSNLNQLKAITDGTDY